MVWNVNGGERGLSQHQREASGLAALHSLLRDLRLPQLGGRPACNFTPKYRLYFYLTLRMVQLAQGQPKQQAPGLHSTNSPKIIAAMRSRHCLLQPFPRGSAASLQRSLPALS